MVSREISNFESEEAQPADDWQQRRFNRLSTTGLSLLGVGSLGYAVAEMADVEHMVVPFVGVTALGLATTALAVIVRSRELER